MDKIRSLLLSRQTLPFSPVPFHGVGIPQCMSGPNMGDLRTRGDLPKFVFTPQGGRWAQGATGGIKGTKAPVPPRVQAKEENDCRWIKMQWELHEMFYLGQNEGFSPGDSISDSFIKLFQRGWSWGKVNIFGTYFTKGFLLVTRNLCHHGGMWDLVLFRI